MTGDGNCRRLIEDYLPIREISEESRIENSVTQARGYLSKALLSILHRWWARRPLAACRAAVYGALVPASQFVPVNGTNGQRKSLGRANAAKFVKALSQRTVSREILEQAAKHIREALGGRAPRVLDMFAGGGSIPLEAARLGCESYALELNPVAHLVELATLVYPAQFGHKLAEEVRRWSEVVFERAENEVGDLYPPIPDPEAKPARLSLKRQARFDAAGFEPRQAELETPGGYLTPVAYLWTRTVPCPRPRSSHVVPLHRQTWLRKNAGGFVALKPFARKGKDRVEYELLKSNAKEARQAVSEWGFDPEDLSAGGETTCPFCHAPVPSPHVKASGKSGAMRTQLMAVVCKRQGAQGKVYLPAKRAPMAELDASAMERRLETFLGETGLRLGDAKLPPRGTLGFRVQPYGFETWDQLFTARQLFTLLTSVKHVRAAHEEMLKQGLDSELAKAVATYLAFIVDKVAERSNSVCRWFPQAGKIQSPIAEGKMPMMWDFPEANPFADSSGSWTQSTGDVIGALEALVQGGARCKVQRGSALELPYENGFFDALITDPPYYDNVPYSHLADFFYVWLKRSVGHLYSEHFAAAGSPVKAEAVMEPARFGGDAKKAKAEYERMMGLAFEEAHRALKPDAPLVCVYAHKTTAGWATLIDALRKTSFVVTEAWPIDTENPSRQRSKESAALASSIFLVARRREGKAKGQYEDVRPELEAIVRERVHSLWDAGMTGADLVIACVGSGLRAFTRFDRVEYSNGEEAPAERFLAEVESVVLETILARLSKEIGAGDGRAGLGSADRATRFYVLWRYTYKTPVLDAGEAIVFANGTEIELDGPTGLSTGARRLVEKKQGKYWLLDFTDRGADDGLGVPEDGRPAPLIDVLHRTLWLMENHSSRIPEFLRETEPNREQLRLVTQALAGPALKGGELGSTAPPAELSALAKLRDNWRSIVEDAYVTAEERQDRQIGQGRISFEKGNRQ